MNANWHGLFRGKAALKRVHRAHRWSTQLGNVARKTTATLWYSVFAIRLGNLRPRQPALREVRAGQLPAARAATSGAWRNLDHVNGGVNHFGSPFNFPEEFITVYRLHPLVPDLIEFRQSRAAQRDRKKVPIIKTFRGKATAAMHEGGLANWALSMGRQRLGVLTLQNHPQFMQNLPDARG